MKANELRIGNLVYYNEKIRKVYSINPNILFLVSSKGYELVNYDEIEPLEITPELLEKAGFKEITNNSPRTYYLELELGRYLLNVITEHNGKCMFSLRDTHFPICESYCFVKYFHQLQNLIFDLTGEEITI